MHTTPLLLVLLGLLLQGPSPKKSVGTESQLMRDARAKFAVQDYRGSMELFEELTLEEPDNGKAWYFYGFSLHALGDYAAAAPIHVKAASFEAVEVNASYNAACAFARLGEADLAFEWLERARAAGFSNPQQLLTDPDLASVRSDPRFAKQLPIGQPVTFVESSGVLRALAGEAPGDRFGWIGRSAGDTDGDGVQDLLLSAPFKNLGGPSAGRIYVYSGKTGELRFQVDGAPGHQLGISIECAGDVNGDGVPDQVAGAVGAFTTGMALVVSGVDGERLLELPGEKPGDAFGRSVAGAGDQDGDGVPDVIVGAPNHDGSAVDSGRVYVFSGRTGKRLFALDGKTANGNFGSVVDGYSSKGLRLLVVGAPGEGPGGNGRVHVFRVEKGVASQAFVIDAQRGDANLGYMFASVVGDVNGDGTPDVYASDWNSNAGGVAGVGRIVVHSGADGARLLSLTGEKAGDGFGIGSAEAGDVDGDGCDDLIIGAWQSDAGAPAGGRCYIHSGRTGERLRTYTCSTPGETFGFDATGLGDVNGDGGLDFLITGADSFASGIQSGRAVVLRGPLRSRR